VFENNKDGTRYKNSHVFNPVCRVCRSERFYRVKRYI